jgi:hypothetical protein
MALASEPHLLAARHTSAMRNTAPLLVLVAVAAFAAVRPVSAEQQKTVAPLTVGDAFPRLEAEFLTGRKAVLPDAAAGRFALVMMGFTYDSRFDVEKWAEHVRAEYNANTGVTFFEVPVIGGMGRLAKWFIDSGMRKGTPKELHENVITVYRGADRWKAAMGFSKEQEDAAYLALLGPDGRVQWLHRGGFSDDALAALKAAIAGEPGDRAAH